MALSRPLSRSLSRALSRAISGGIGLIRRLLDLYPGASAAYSLQDIGGGGNVIRARRSVDNEERDFAAAQIGDPLRQFAMNDSAELLGYAKAGNRMYFDGSDDYVELPFDIASCTNATITLYDVVIDGTTGILLGDSPSASDFVLCYESGSSSPSNSVTGSQPTYVDGVLIGTTRDNLYTALSDGLPHTVQVTSANISTWVNGPYLGWYLPNAAYRHEGIIGRVTVDYTGDGTLDADYPGTGNTDADWEDQVGSNDGTVNGSPALFTGQGFNAFVTTWYDQSGSLGEELSRFANRKNASDARMQFDGVDDYVAIPFNAASATNATVVIHDVLIQDTTGILLGSSTSGSFFALCYQSGNGSASSVNSGTPTTYVDGVAIASTRAALYTALNDGLPHKVEIRGADLTAWWDDLGVGWYFSDPGFRHEGTAGRVTVDYTGDGTLDIDCSGTGNTNADWEDQVGSNDGTVNGSPSLYEGRNALQETAASQPQIVADGVVVTGTNGQPSMKFDGTGTLLKTGGFTLTQPNTHFAVADTTGNNSHHIFDSASGDRNTWFHGASREVSIFAGSVVSGSTAAVGDSVVALLADGASSKGHSNGSLVVSGDIGTQSMNGVCIGAFPGNVGPTAWDTTISEYISYNSDQSASREAIESDIANRYGITLS